MTDELSKGLAEIGEEVIVITPLYEDKARSPALQKMFDEDEILHIQNI